MSMHGSDFGVGVDAGEGFRGRGVRISITGIRLGALRSRSGVICIGPTALRGVTSDRHASTSMNTGMKNGDFPPSCDT